MLFDVITQKGALSPSIPTDSVILGVTNAYYLSQNGAPPKEGLKWVGGTPKMKWVGGTRSISRWRPPGVLRYLQSLIPGTTDSVIQGETNPFLLQPPCPDPPGVLQYLQSLIPGTTDSVILGETNAFLLQPPFPDPQGVLQYLQSLIPGTTGSVILGSMNAFLLQPPSSDPLGTHFCSSLPVLTR